MSRDNLETTGDESAGRCLSGVSRELVRDGPLENLLGGRAKYKKNIRARENEMKKNSCTPINPKKYSCYWLKKNSYKEFDNEKKFLRLENSPPPP